MVALVTRSLMPLQVVPAGPGSASAWTEPGNVRESLYVAGKPGYLAQSAEERAGERVPMATRPRNGEIALASPELLRRADQFSYLGAYDQRTA